MKVFISWSGPLSKAVAELLASWIPDVLQGTATWISNKDIEKGAIWFDEIQSTLSDVGTGILCVTAENMNAPWLLFEAGALSKGLTKNRVIPLLINIEAANVRPPLGQFNCVHPTKDDFKKLLTTINRQKGDAALTEDRVSKSFEKWWPEFKVGFEKAVAEGKQEEKPKQRNAEDLLGELLELTRSIHGTIAAKRRSERGVVYQMLESFANEKHRNDSALISEQLEDLKARLERLQAP